MIYDVNCFLKKEADECIDSLKQIRSQIEEVASLLSQSENNQTIQTMQLAPLAGECSSSTYTICDSCITSLRDATTFKQQVLLCERNFKKMNNWSDVKEDGVFCLDVKKESSPENDGRKWAAITNIRSTSKDSPNLNQTLHHISGLNGIELERRVSCGRQKYKDADPDVKSEEIYLDPEDKAERIDSKTHIKLGDTDSNTDVKVGDVDHNATVNEGDTDSDPDAAWVKPPDYTNYKPIRKSKIKAKKRPHSACTNKTSIGTLETKLRNDKDSYTCDLCQANFTNSRDFNKHIETSHPKGNTYPCNICKDVLHSACLLKKHLHEHSKSKEVICNECGKTVSDKRSLIYHMRIHTGEKPFTCDICHKSFIRGQYLVLHMRTHTGEKPYICDTCGYRFARQGALKAHLSAVHAKVMPFECKFCHKRFATKQALKVHERQHTGVSPYSCEVCKKILCTKTSLKLHMRMHTGEKPYSCSICGRQFTQTICLNKHKRTHTGERKFNCGVCKKPFADRGNLKVHMRIHTGEKPFSCDLCTKRFIEKGSLKKHMKVHTGARYPCKVCHKEISDLATHMKLHSTEKPYSCGICSKKFVVNKYLKIHMKTHGKEKLKR